jgi:tetrahydromethanopterin S-methyltransferase subunit E
MIDSNRKYDDLIHRIERTAKGNPKSYQYMVAFLASLSYVYMAFVLLVLVGSLVGIIA